MYGKVLGFDIGSFYLRAIFAKISFKSISIEKKVIIKRLPNESLKDLLIRFQASHETLDFTPVLLLPAENIQYRVLSFPFRSQKEIKQVLKHELEEVLPITADEIISDFFISSAKPGNRNPDDTLEQKADSVEVMSATVRKDFFAGFLEPWMELKMVPGFVGLESVAANAFFHSHFLSLNEGNRLMLDLGFKKTILTVISHGTIRYIRIIPIGAIDFNEIIVEESQVDKDRADDIRITMGNLLWGEDENEKADEFSKKARQSFIKQTGINPLSLGKIRARASSLLRELLREIRLSIFSLFQQKTDSLGKREINELDSLFFTGGFSHQEGIQEIIGENLNLEISNLENQNEFKEIPKGIIEGNGENSDFWKVHGLLLSIVYKSSRNINFLQEEFASLSITRNGSTFKVPAILFSIGLIFFIGNLFFKAALLEQETDSLEIELVNRVKKYFPKVSLGNDPIRSVRGFLVTKKGDISGRSLPGTFGSKLIDILKTVTTSMDKVEGFRLKDLKFSAQRLTIKGYIPTYGTADEIKKKLEISRAFASIDDPKIRKDIAKNALTFSISMKLK